MFKCPVRPSLHVLGRSQWQRTASLVAEDVGVEVADAVGCQEGDDESERPNDQNDRVVQVTRGHGKVTGLGETWKTKELENVKRYDEHPVPSVPHAAACHSSGSNGLVYMHTHVCMYVIVIHLFSCSK